MTLLCKLGLHRWAYWHDHLDHCVAPDCPATRRYDPPHNHSGQPLR